MADPEAVDVPVPTICPLNENDTTPGALDAAVNVTDCPATTGLGDTVTDVVVAVPEACAGVMETNSAPIKVITDTQYDFFTGGLADMFCSMGDPSLTDTEDCIKEKFFLFLS